MKDYYTRLKKMEGATKAGALAILSATHDMSEEDYRLFMDLVEMKAYYEASILAVVSGLKGMTPENCVARAKVYVRELEGAIQQYSHLKPQASMTGGMRVPLKASDASGPALWPGQEKAVQMGLGRFVQPKTDNTVAFEVGDSYSSKDEARAEATKMEAQGIKVVIDYSSEKTDKPWTIFYKKKTEGSMRRSSSRLPVDAVSYNDSEGNDHELLLKFTPDDSVEILVKHQDDWVALKDSGYSKQIQEEIEQEYADHQFRASTEQDEPYNMP